jgi:hypothetical protein
VTAYSTHGWAFDGPEPPDLDDGEWTDWHEGRFPEPLSLYHWAPSVRRAVIRRDGLSAGKRNIAGPVYHDDERPELGEFVQPVVCMAVDPSVAWVLSHGSWAAVARANGTPVDPYRVDLWAIAPDAGDQLTANRFDFDQRSVVDEVRARGPIDPSRLTLIGTRIVN